MCVLITSCALIAHCVENLVNSDEGELLYCALCGPLACELLAIFLPGIGMALTRSGKVLLWQLDV